MRKIDSIIVHCSATKAGQDFTAADIDRWHRERGFNGIGYHYVIRLDGRLEKGREIDLPGAHCKGWNERSIGLCYIGGLDENGHPADTRTNVQKRVLYQVIMDLQREYTILQVLGHRDTSPDLNGDGVIEPYEYVKACPCFDVREFMKSGRELLFVLLLGFVLPGVLSGCRTKKEVISRSSEVQMDSSSSGHSSHVASYDVNQERKMLERMEESTEQILVVLGKDTATGDFSSTCFISGSRKTVNKVFEKKERIDEKEDTQISSFIDTNRHKVVGEEEENSLYYRKNISWMLIISISTLMLLYFIYKKRRILF